MFTRTRCLDRGIQCQQIGLLGHAVDYVDYRADVLRVLGELLDHGARLRKISRQHLDCTHGLLDDTTSIGRLHFGLARRFGGETGVARHLLHGRNHLVHGRCKTGGLELLGFGIALRVIRYLGKMIAGSEQL